MLVLVIDWVWIAIAIVGIGVSVWAFIDSYLDGRSRRRAHVNGAMSAIVRINLRGAVASLTLHSFFLVLGGIALTAPLRTRPTMFFLLLAGGYIAVAAFNVVSVGLNQVERFRLRQ